MRAGGTPPVIEQLQDEIGRLSSLKQAYKQAWSDLEDAIDDIDEMEPWPRQLEHLRNAADVIRQRLEANR